MAIEAIKRTRGGRSNGPDEVVADRGRDGEDKIRTPLRQRRVDPLIVRGNIEHGSGPACGAREMGEHTDDELNQIRIWNRYAKRGYLQSTIDPRDKKGLKCDYIDKWSRYYIEKFVLDTRKTDVLEIGCGSGRNLFFLSPFINHGYGIDIAEEQIKNAEARKRELGMSNVTFSTDPEKCSCWGRRIRVVFTMWVLQHCADDDALCAMLADYRRMLPLADRFVFFEQVARECYTVNEGGRLYKKVRSVADYRRILSGAGIPMRSFTVLNEKGFGPFYRAVYGGPLYWCWPRWLRINALLFALDRRLVHRTVSKRFTDCVFICERQERCVTSA